MKKYIFPLILPGMLLMAACNSKTTETTASGNADSASKSQTAPVTHEVKLGCREIASMDEMVPLSEIQLIVDGNAIPVDSANACNVITKDEYDNYHIPANAQEAVGGWWAGGGDYFYLAVEGNEAVVYYGWADEGAEEKDMYQYKAIHREKL